MSDRPATVDFGAPDKFGAHVFRVEIPASRKESVLIFEDYGYRGEEGGIPRDEERVVLRRTIWTTIADTTRREFNEIVGPRMMVSDDGGRTWSKLIEVLPPEHRKNWSGEEFDAAELSNGDLLCVFRKAGEKVRWQGVMKKTGKTWIKPPRLFLTKR